MNLLPHVPYGYPSPPVDAADWDARYSTTELLWTAEPNRFLVAEVAGLPAGRALDLACGEGRNAVWLAERGWLVTGVDFSGVALDKGARPAAERGVDVDFFQADVTTFAPPPGAYELVIVLYLQLPEAERRAALGHAARRCRPPGPCGQPSTTAMDCVRVDSVNRPDPWPASVR